MASHATLTVRLWTVPGYRWIAATLWLLADYGLPLWIANQIIGRLVWTKVGCARWSPLPLAIKRVTP